MENQELFILKNNITGLEEIELKEIEKYIEEVIVVFESQNKA